MLTTGALGAVAGRFGSCQSTNNDCRSAADSSVDLDGIYRAVECAGAALHAAIELGDGSLADINREDSMRADDRARSATHALLFIEFQRRNIWKVLHLISRETLRLSRRWSL